MTALEENFHALNLNKESILYNMTLHIVRGKSIDTILKSAKWGCHNYKDDIINILKKLQIDYVICEGPPRFGKPSSYIKITTEVIRMHTIANIIYD